ncbi:MAG TPA: hypothetical protein VL361_17380 [Candidatus Limnocylindrales bacterium]|nr:hypothetical protein [Candidatus Limnocylindrales bacterium]
MHRPIPYELKQFSSHHTTDVCLRICGPLVPYRETLDLELVDGPEQRPLAHFKFRLLHRAAVESRLLQSLKARNSRLWVQNRTGCRPAQVVGATSGFLVAEFLVPPADWSAFAPPVETILKVELVSPRGRVEIERQPITLTSKAFTFRTPKLALGDQDLFPEPGNYRLTVSLGPQVVAVLPFEFIGQREMLHRIKVPQISISAQTRAGDLVPGLTTLRWEEHRAVLASMQISSDISAPDTLVNCNASISEGGMVIRNEDIVFPLDRPSRTIKLHPLEFGVTGLQTQPKPARLTVAVTVEGEEKASMVVLVLPPERITNFEGQLTFEVKDLPFDEIEYNQIVQRLRLCDDSSPQRGLWGWLQSKILRD